MQRIAHAVYLVLAQATLGTAMGGETGPAGEQTSEGPAATVETIAVQDPATADRAEPAKTSGAGTIAEIIVTAQKREENIQDVPISVQAFSGEDLEAKGISDPAKLQYSTPGLIYDQLAGYNIIFLRGVGTDAFIPSADLSVATYIDGVYYPFSVNLARAFGPVQRIEVLKGPQGTLFGRNSTGGAINIVTADPSDSYGGSITASAGSYNNLQSSALVSGPLFGGLSASVGVLYSRSDSYYKYAKGSPNDGKDIQDDSQIGATAKLKWQPANAFDASLTGSAIRLRSANSYLLINEKPAPLVGQAAGLEGPGKAYRTNANTEARGEFQAGTAALTLGIHPPWFDIKSISSYQRLHGGGRDDFDGTDKNIASQTILPEDLPAADGKDPQFARAVTQEIQLLSNGEWGPGWLTWIVGGYFLDSRAGYQPAGTTAAGLPDIFSGQVLGALGYTPEIVSVINLIDSLGLPTVGFTVNDFGLIHTRSYAGFGQLTADLGEWLSITVGGRYQEESRRIYNSYSNIALQDGTEVPLFSFPDDSLHKTNFSPKVTLASHPLDDVMTYASWSKGFKSGSFNLVALTQAPGQIRPEYVTAWEVGVKSNPLPSLQFNAAAFVNQIRDLQVQFISLLSGGLVHFENAKKAQIRGAEIDGAWAITNELTWTVGGTWLHGRYKKYPDASGFDPTTGLLQSGLDFSGNHIVRNPRFIVATGLAYELAVPGGSLQPSVDLYRNSGYWFDAQNTVKQKAYSRVNAQLGYLYDSADLRVSVFGDNLTNAKIHAYRFPSDFGVLGQLSAPRTFGVRARWEFGE